MACFASGRRPFVHEAWHHPNVSKRRRWDVRAMDEADLRALVARCNRMDKALQAPHAKARRGWVDLRRHAQAELESRAL
jgi:hypothetical protein